MDVVEFIKSARALITNPENWTTDLLACDDYGCEVDPGDEKAVCFCILGALSRISLINNDYKTKCLAERHIYNYINKIDNYVNLYAMRDIISTFNDTHGHDEMLAILDSVILKLEGNEAIKTGNAQ